MKLKSISLFLLFVLCNKIYAQTERKYGLIFDQEAFDKIEKSAKLTTKSYGTLPSSASLKRYCPIPKNQSFQDCVGWATTYAGRTILASRNFSFTNPTNEAFAPSFVYDQIKSNPVCEDGSKIEEALRLLANQGVPKYNDFPYICSPPITDRDRQNAYPNRIRGFQGLESLDDVKRCLSEGKPVIIGANVYPSFNNSTGIDLWNGVPGQLLGGHAMCVIGFDDNKYGGAVEIINSWGTSWGNQGFIWVRYQDFLNTFCKYAYEMIDYDRPKPTPPAPTPQPTPQPTPPTPQPTETLFSGEMRLIQENQEVMTASLAPNANKDFAIEEVDKSTYRLDKPQKSNTRFRIYFTNNEPAYVYLIGYGSTTQKVTSLFPFNNFSPYLSYKSSEVAIPNEDFYIKIDNNIGTDYLCILYCKEKLDLANLTQKLQSQNGSFITRLKGALKDRIVQGNDITFEQKGIAFKAKSRTKDIIPIVLEVKHIN